MIVVMAVVTEGVISYLKSLVVDRKIKWQMVAAVILGIIISICYGLDIPALLGIKSAVPFLSNIITGILISRGSNYIYDLFKTITANINSKQTEREI